MNIMDLEEAEGLTEARVDAWLVANDWLLRDGLWRNPDGAVIANPHDTARLLELIADLSCQTPQALLREMNPRMRRGLPSMAERKAQQHWICVRGDAMEFLQVKNYPDEGGLFRSGGMGRIVEACYSDALSWPCDAHGNKVLWPATKEGVR